MTTSDRSGSAQLTRAFPFALRPLVEADIPQAEAIERDAFPSVYPPTAFRREVKHGRAFYLVSCRQEDVDDGRQRPTASPATDRPAGAGVVGRLLNGARGLWPGHEPPFPPAVQTLYGFVGTWQMLDEAHIVAVGVRSQWRGRGIGEMLLIGALEEAMARDARVATLEVRVSNLVARSLYIKYGFSERGVRKAYYADNDEDALIMTTDPIGEEGYVARFRELMASHEQRWGRSLRYVGPDYRKGLPW